MSLSTRIHTSWQLLQTSLRVIRQHPKLLLFPVLSALCFIALALFFFAPILLLRFGGAWAEQRGWTVTKEYFNAVFYVYGAVTYLVSMFAATFFNVAFYNEILRALAGEPVSLRSGLQFALRRIRAILMWSLLAGTVGLIIRTIEERLGWLGKIAMGLIGTAWSVAAVFAIPVILRREDSNPLAVLRDSAATLKKTWGESLVGFVGIQLSGLVIVGGLIVFLGLTVIGTGFFHFGWFGFVLMVAAVLALIAASLVLNMATHVYRCALYVYASEGVVPGDYTAEMMDAGWKVKK